LRGRDDQFETTRLSGGRACVTSFETFDDVAVRMVRGQLSSAGSVRICG
jgi:hypothetical protein